VRKTEENTHHIFKCKKFQDVNEKIKGESLKEVLKNKNKNEIAMVKKKSSGENPIKMIKTPNKNSMHHSPTYM